MRTFRFTGVFAAGLISGLLILWMPSPSARGSDRDGISGGGAISTVVGGRPTASNGGIECGIEHAIERAIWTFE